MPIYLTCPKCNLLIEPIVIIRFMKNKNYTEKQDIKFKFCLKAICSECRDYIKFLPHTDENINLFDNSELIWKK